MGFCTPEQHRRFLNYAPKSKSIWLDAGIILIKYWMEVGKKEQQRRFEARIEDPLRQWKLSPMDLESFSALVTSIPVYAIRCSKPRIQSMRRGTSFGQTIRRKHG